MTVNSRAQRREQRRADVERVFGSAVEAALDLLELTELAWHDCYGEVAPPDGVVDDLLTVSRGRLDLLSSAARLAVEDARDLRIQAEAVRGQQTARGTSLVRYRFSVVEWYATDRRREYQVLTDAGAHKAAWMAGAAFAAKHPRTPIRSLRLLSEEAPAHDAQGVLIVDEHDLRDQLEWR